MTPASISELYDEQTRLTAARVLRDKGNFQQAQGLLTELAQGKFKHAEVLTELAVLAIAMGDTSMGQHYHHLAVAADHGRLETFLHTGQAFAQQKNDTAALECFERAYALGDRSAALLRELWRASRRLGKSESTEKYFEILLLIDPYPDLLRLENIAAGETVMQDADTLHAARQKFLKDLSAIGVFEITDCLADMHHYRIKAPLGMVYHGESTLALRKAYAQHFSSRMMKNFPYAPDAPMRVGIFVDSPHEPIFIKIIGGILHRWRAKDIQLSVVCEKENLAQMKSWVANPAVEFLEFSSYPPHAIKTISAARFDLLYFWEVGTTNLNYILPMLRLAPVQCTSWGSMQTTGLEAMDYFISSRHQESEDAQDHYSETLVRLEHMPTYFYKPDMTGFPTMTRADFGVAAAAHLYICPQHVWKIHPDFDRLADQVLTKDKEGVLCMIEAKDPHATQNLKNRMKRNMQTFERVRFIPYQEMAGFLNLLQLADVMLDLPHFGGGQTSLEAFAFGTPIVTMPGKFLGSRSTYAAYRAMGMDSCIAKDGADYVNKAVRLATDRELRQQVKQEILAKNAVLFENDATLSEHEAFFREAISKYRASRKPVFSQKPKVLNVGGNDVLTHPLPRQYQEFTQEVLDIDPAAKPHIVCDAREMTTLSPGLYDAIYCSHNLEHYYAHDVPKVLAGFKHVLKTRGFVEAWVPDMQAVMEAMRQKKLSLEDVLYQSPGGPIHVRDIFWGFDKQIESSGQDFYAHKMGFSGETLQQYFLKSGFSTCRIVSRGSAYEVGVLAFVNPPDDAMRQLFGLDKQGT